MAETITRQLREPFVETAGLALTEAALPYLKPDYKIPTSTYTGAQFVAPQAALEQQVASAAGGLGGLLGPTAYQQFMSPYQQEVISATQADLARQKQKGLAALQAQAVGAGAFGGAREGVAAGEYSATQDIGAAKLLADIRQQGFTQAQQQALAQLQAAQGLGTYQSQLGAQQRQIEQARLAAQQEAARESAFEPFTRLGLVGPQLASVIGGFPAATQVQTTPPPSTTQQLLGLGIGALGLGGAAKGIFG